MTYRVVAGRSVCGLHVGHGGCPGKGGTNRDMCRVCAQANAANRDALEGVIPKPAIAANQWRQTIPEVTKAKAREMYAAGESISAITRACGIAHSTINEIVGKPTKKRGSRFSPDRDKHGANEAIWARGSKAMRDEQRTHPLPRGVHV